MRGHLTDEEIAAYATGSPSLEAQQEINDHAAVCAECLKALMNALNERIRRSATKESTGSPRNGRDVPG
jgi:hypothetical protein